MTSASSLAKTFSPPYYAVIFTSRRTPEDRGYNQMAERMVALGSQMPGFLGVESVRNVDGFGITVFYWQSEDAIRQWKAHAEHQIAQRTGKAVWYTDYIVRIAKVEREYCMMPEQLQQRSPSAKPTEILPSTWFSR
jgi:heme-degrading monooxygenase HmoA